MFRVRRGPSGAGGKRANIFNIFLQIKKTVTLTYGLTRYIRVSRGRGRGQGAVVKVGIVKRGSSKNGKKRAKKNLGLRQSSRWKRGSSPEQKSDEWELSSRALPPILARKKIFKEIFPLKKNS